MRKIAYHENNKYVVHTNREDYLHRLICQSKKYHAQNLIHIRLYSHFLFDYMDGLRSRIFQ